MATITVNENQDIFDVMIQNYGDLENLADFLASNPDLTLNSNIKSGQELTVNNENLGEVVVKDFFTLRNFTVVNIDEVGLFTPAGDYSDDYSDDYEI